MAGSVGQPKQKYWWMGALAEKCGRAPRQNGWIFGVPGAQTNLDLPGTYSFPGILSYTWGVMGGDWDYLTLLPYQLPLPSSSSFFLLEIP